MYLTKEEIYMMLLHLNDEQLVKVYHYINTLQKEQKITSSLDVNPDSKTPK
ncbi:hypothetical protein [Bacillus sp. LL01]|jgi:hypothetical protein|uniref:hypothetical protein n=1 Tax=Bacillus sp. LL01 TaxID=1665556 RepID=UPI000B17454F|nr:hypothetical protein [Bacillus sp. LL01]